MRANLWMLCAITSLAVAATAEAQPGGGRGGRGGFGGGRGASIFSVAGNEAVQKDLGLSTDAAAKVKTVTDDYSAAIRESFGANGGNFREMSQEERTKAFAKMQETRKTTTEKFLPKLKEVLTPDQFTRAQQIHWQAMGTAALTEPEVIKGIPLASDQQEKIKTLTTEYDAKGRELFAGGGGGGGGGGNREKAQELNKERDAKITDVLTKEQQDKFASLKGKEFDVAQLRGPGGPGGGGGTGAPDSGGGRPKRPQPKAQ